MDGAHIRTSSTLLCRCQLSVLTVYRNLPVVGPEQEGSVLCLGPGWRASSFLRPAPTRGKTAQLASTSKSAVFQALWMGASRGPRPAAPDLSKWLSMPSLQLIKNKLMFLNIDFSRFETLPWNNCFKFPQQNEVLKVSLIFYVGVSLQRLQQQHILFSIILLVTKYCHLPKIMA